MEQHIEVPALGNVVDLGERFKKPEVVRVRTIVIPAQDGVLVHDSRLGQAAFVEGNFIWVLGADGLEEAQPPIVLPHYE